MIEFLKAAPVLSNIYKNLESDLSQYEKIERQNQFDKKRTLLIVSGCIGVFTFFSWLFFKLYLLYGILSWGLNLMLLLFVTLIGMLFNRIKKPDSPDYFLAIWHPFMTLTFQNFFVCSVTSLTAEINFSTLSLSLLFLIGTWVHYLIGYELLKERFVTRIIHTLTFVMADGQNLRADLISITKRGDFVVKIDGCEVCLNRSFVQKIMIPTQNLSNS